jgi:transcriptional regulator with GAF, ATPase, and Fis domain
MSTEPAALHFARVNFAARSFEKAVECLETAARGDPGSPEVLALANEIAGADAVPAPLKTRARAVAAKTVPKAAPAPAPRRELPTEEAVAVAQEVLASPDLVRALKAALGAGSPGRPLVSVESVVARLLDCDLDFGSVSEVALDLVLEATGAARALLLLRDERGRLELARGRGLERKDVPAEVSSSILEAAERAGAPLLVADALADEEFGRAESVQSLGLRSVACVPIMAPGLRRAIAALWIDHPALARGFEDGTRELLSALARTLAGPLRNAQRFEAQRAARRQKVDDEAKTSRTLLVGRSPSIEQVRELVARVAPHPVPVLVLGETGTGKELVARSLHEHSARKGAFVAENMAAIPAALLESELFGVARGAFTGADRDAPGAFLRARQGTVFLDEVGELSLEAQAKLLRVLQEGEVRPVGGDRVERTDARVVAATNRDLPAMVREGRFREDLLYRLRVVTIRIPPLRERLEDLPLLVEHVLERIARERGEPVAPPSPRALAALAARAWPGNVRELENTLWQVALLGEGVLDEPSRPLEARSLGPLSLSVELAGAPPSLEDARLAFDRSFLEAVLAWSKGHRTEAARALGVTREGLSKLLKRVGLARKKDS